MPRLRSTALRTAFTAVAVTLGAAVLSPAVTQVAAATTTSCASYSQPAYQRVNPKTGAQLITLNAGEAAKAPASYGYAQYLGVAFKASGLRKSTVVVHRLTRSKPTDAYWSANAAEIAKLKKAGYADQGGNFLASATANSCVVAVYGLSKGPLHRQSADAATVASLKKAGWTSFYAAPAKSVASTAPVSLPKPTPTPTPAPKPTPTPAPKPTPTPTPKPTPTPTPAPKPAPTPTPAPTPSPTASPSATASPSPTVSPTPTPEPTPSPSPVTDSGLPTGPTDLDPSGQSIPDTAYPIPAGAIFISPTGADTNPGTLAAPVKSLNRAIDLAPANGTIVFRGGTYRDSHSKSSTTYTIAGKGVTLQAYPHEKPWLDGSDAVPAASWTADGAGHWSTPWSTPDFCGAKYYNAAPHTSKTACTYSDMIHGSATNPVPADPQQVFVDGDRQHQTNTLDKVDGSNFSYDWSARRMYIGVDPDAHPVELTKRPMAVVLAGANRNTILGLGFRRYASYPYEGVNAAVYVGGFATVKDSAFSHNNWEDTGVGCTVSCGQAAVKLAHMRGYRITGNLVQSTGGGAVGLWCDLDCSAGVYTSNVVRDQPKSSGIFVEVGDTTIVAGNLVTGNVYGISVASAHTEIYNNTLIDNVQAIRIYDDHRSRGEDWGGKVWNDVGPDTTGVSIANNLAYSTSYSIIAFPMTAGSVAPNTGAESFFSSIDHNAFFQASGGSPTFVKMTSLAGVVDSYKDYATMGQATGFERDSVWTSGADPLVDRARGDYRLKSQYAAQLGMAPVPADVAAALGLKPNTAVGMGAGLRH